MKPVVVGANPTYHPNSEVAQLIEQHADNVQVDGLSPSFGTNLVCGSVGISLNQSIFQCWHDAGVAVKGTRAEVHIRL